MYQNNFLFVRYSPQLPQYCDRELTNTLRTQRKVDNSIAVGNKQILKITWHRCWKALVKTNANLIKIIINSHEMKLKIENITKAVKDEKNNQTKIESTLDQLIAEEHQQE